ncbi:MAG: nuclear transport factor 2 family protein [Actinobacteria bacterium]|nr:nuclear transport factor 2 family protein [Actinomycetota bacterium]
MTGAEVLRAFQEAMQARDWERARPLLHDELVVVYPHTGERFVGGDAFLAMNRAFPEGWTISVRQVIEEGERVAAEIRVEQDGSVFWSVSFAVVRDGRIVHLTDYWVTERGEQPPGWRAAFAS